MGVTDVTHLLRAVAGNAVFIEPEAECVAPLGALGDRPDLVVRTRVWGNDGDSGTAIVGTNLDLHYDILMVGDDAASNPGADMPVNVTSGTLVDSRDVCASGVCVAHPVPEASSYGYSRAAGRSAHSAVLLATYVRVRVRVS